jgi:hypothetical protein
MLERNKKPLYYCHRLNPGDEGYTEGFELFATPVVRYLNFKSLSGEAMLTTGGEVNKKDLVAKLYSGEPQYFENDRCYVYKIPPVEFDPFCSDADYRVTAILPAKNVVEVIFERTA